MQSMEMVIKGAGVRIAAQGDDAVLLLPGELVPVLEGVRSMMCDTFAELARFTETTARELGSFNSMIKPYLDYFYPDDPSRRDTFIRDVVEPGRDEMLAEVGRAVRIMEEDASVYGAIEEAITRSLALKDGFNGILSIIEEIEIYFLNTMIVSIKAGPGGEALTMISREMGNLSAATSSVSSRFNGIIGKMEKEYADFRKIRREIEVIQENRLTRITLDIRSIFADMIGELCGLSRDVNSIMETGRRIEKFALAELPGLQMEDLYSQDIDKVLFLVEAVRGCGADTGRHDDIEEVCARMVRDKMAAIMEELSSHTEGFCGIIGLSGGLSEGILEKLRGDGNGRDGRAGGAGLDGIYARFEKLRDEFVAGIDMITENKRGISLVAERICGIVAAFGGFFSDIAHITRKLEVINMLTRIELARNGGLADLLGGSLDEISKLPGAIKRRAAEAEFVYREVKEGVDSNIAAYRKTIRSQESSLEDIAGSIKRISVKLYESRKYFGDIVHALEKSAGDLADFISGGSANVARLESMVETLRGIGGNGGPAGFPDAAGDCPQELKDAMRTLEARLAGGFGDGDYRKSLVRSFFQEYLDDRESAKISFF